VPCKRRIYKNSGNILKQHIQVLNKKENTKMLCFKWREAGQSWHSNGNTTLKISAIQFFLAD
jgi:hypothetical protein